MSKTVSENFGAESGFQGSNKNIAINLAGFDVYKSVGTTFDLSPTDYGSVNRSFALVDDVNNRTFDYADEQIDRAFTFSTGITNRALDVADGALVFADDQLNRNYEYVTAIGNAALAEVERNRQFAADVIAQNSASNAAATNAAFSFAGQATTKAIDTIAASTTEVFDQIGEGYTAAIDGITSSANASLAYANQNNERTFSLYNKVIDESNNLLNGLTGFTKDLLTDQSAQNTATIAAVSDATRSDAAQSFNKLIKYTAAAFAIFAVSTVVLKVKFS